MSGGNLLTVQEFFQAASNGTVSSIPHVCQILHHGANGVLGVIDAQVAVLMRCKKSAQKGRPIPIREMLGVGVGVLQSGEELQSALQRLPIARVASDVAGFTGDPT